MTLFCPFRPVLCLFCPLLCPFCPSHKKLKFTGPVLLLLRSGTVNMAKPVFGDCPIPYCGAKYLVKLSNQLTNVYELDYISRRKKLQEAKLQPNVRVMIYPVKRGQGLRPPTSETILSVQEEEKETIVHQ